MLKGSYRSGNSNPVALNLNWRYQYKVMVFSKTTLLKEQNSERAAWGGFLLDMLE